MSSLVDKINKRISKETLKIGEYDGELMTLLYLCKAAMSQQDAVGSVRIDVDGMQLRLSKPMPEGKYSLYTAPPSTAQEGTVYVCPLKDSECGNKSTWCEACPQRKPTAQGVEPVLQVTGRSDYPGYVIAAEINGHGATLGQKYCASPPLENGMVRVPVDTLQCVYEAAASGLRKARSLNHPNALKWNNPIVDVSDLLKAAKGE